VINLPPAIPETDSTMLSSVGNSNCRPSGILIVARHWESVAGLQLNERQRKVLNLFLDDFEGNLTTSKWAKLTKCSQDTATRDIAHLVEQGILVRNPGGGRSTSYALKEQLSGSVE
jgi:predicted HTH transcriptional regulator